MLKWLLQIGRTVWELLCPVQPLKVGISLAVRDTIEFDWLRDYGPLWEPDCTAFWLDPDTEEQRNAWQRKYRPVVNDFDRATLGGYQHFRELTDAQMVKQMAIMAGTTPAMLAQSQAVGSQAYGLMNYQMQKQVQQLEYLQKQDSLWNALFGVRI